MIGVDGSTLPFSSTKMSSFIAVPPSLLAPLRIYCITFELVSVRIDAEGSDVPMFSWPAESFLTSLETLPDFTVEGTEKRLIDALFVFASSKRKCVQDQSTGVVIFEVLPAFI